MHASLGYASVYISLVNQLQVLPYGNWSAWSELSVVNHDTKHYLGSVYTMAKIMVTVQCDFTIHNSRYIPWGASP